MTYKKILYVINHADWFWSHRLPLALGAQQDSWDVHVAVPGGSADTRFKDYSFTVHDIDDGFFASMHSIRKVADAIKPDLVHAITIKTAFLTGLALPGKTKKVFTIAGLGFLFSQQGIKPKLLRALTGPLLKRTLRGAAIIVQNPDDQKTLVKHRLIDQSQVVLIRGSGVDIEKFCPRPGSEKLPPIVLMPTRLIREKGVEIFVQGARILKEKNVKARFVVVGRLDHTNPYALSEHDMRVLTEGSAVEWAGKTSDMPRALNECTLVAYPSWYGEGIPKVLLEAAACGKAIVTTDHTGCREAVRDGINGLLVPVRDAQALADGIEKLLHDPAMRARMGDEGRSRAEKEFDVKLIVEQTLAVYKKA